MAGETNLEILLKNLKPVLNEGDYVFCSVADLSLINLKNVIGTFTETQGTTIILSRANADKLNLPYSSVFSWITLNIHSSLDAIGLTAAFSTALSKEGISCNVIAAYYHDHIFINKKDAGKAMEVLMALAD